MARYFFQSIGLKPRNWLLSYFLLPSLNSDQPHGTQSFPRPRTYPRRCRPHRRRHHARGAGLFREENFWATLAGIPSSTHQSGAAAQWPGPGPVRGGLVSRSVAVDLVRGGLPARRLAGVEAGVEPHPVPRYFHRVFPDGGSYPRSVCHPRVPRRRSRYAFLYHRGAVSGRRRAAGAPFHQGPARRAARRGDGRAGRKVPGCESGEC